MTKKSLLAYFILWILLQVLVEVNCQMTPFKPRVSHSHTATIIDNKLYILGGIGLKYLVEKELFYLDFSVSFNTQNLLWKDISSIDMLPPHSSATSVKGFTYDQTMALIYTFVPQNNSWSIPKITGIQKMFLSGVIDNNRKMYLWGGCYRPDNVDCVFVNANWDYIQRDKIKFYLDLPHDLKLSL
ncbi:hypothetical protein C1645_832440 [Glomus cerebriforme]|uniref:Galactose oxidase n=1 Tax=Glomus cerebriforme TaxID=658196 RepID=A0A397SK15_9GLOM|nr:hypothetical protein C1645_832440 [Glomus cerebriforme]